MDFLKSQSLISYGHLLWNGQHIGQLEAIYDSQKSFYNKANIYELNGILYLVSYTTIVAKIFNNHAQIFGWYSRTTAKHINEFLKQHNFKALTKKEMENSNDFHGVLIEC